MLPINSINYDKFDVIVLPSNTFKINFNKNEIKNNIDNVNALKQAIYKILMTKRYLHAIYDWNYGVEIDDLIGMPKAMVKSQIPNRITDALIIDDRIITVCDFEFFDGKNKGELIVKFCVKSIFGNIYLDWEVNF